MLGATAVQIGTSLILLGIDHLSKILEDIQTWMDKNNVKDINEIRGVALKELKSFDDIKLVRG